MEGILAVRNCLPTPRNALPGKIRSSRRTITEEVYKTGEIFEGQVYVKLGEWISCVGDSEPADKCSRRIQPWRQFEYDRTWPGAS